MCQKESIRGRSKCKTRSLNTGAADINRISIGSDKRGTQKIGSKSWQVPQKNPQKHSEKTRNTRDKNAQPASQVK